jgi:hypothetical protein
VGVDASGMPPNFPDNSESHDQTDGKKGFDPHAQHKVDVDDHDVPHFPTHDHGDDDDYDQTI